MSIDKLRVFYIFLIFLTIYACSPKRDPNTGKIIRQETNVNKKVENARVGILTGRNQKGTTYEFATSNVMWRATLNTLDFMPLANVSYSGGIITTDWYKTDKSNESIKINVRFLSNELGPSSMSISSFKKICNTQDNNCKILKNSNDLNLKIKDKIILEARKLKITDEEKK